MSVSSSTVISAAPVSGSTVHGSAGGAAAAAAAAASPVPVTNAEVSLTAGLEQLDAGQVAAAFMGSEVVLEEAEDEVVEVIDDDAADGDAAAADADADGEGDADGDADADPDAEAEGDPEDEADPEPEGHLEKGLLKALADKPGLHKRVKKLFEQNKLLKSQVEAVTGEPVVLTSPEVTGQMFADARSVSEVERAAEVAVRDARQKLRWLNRHPDGGVYGEGEYAQELTPQQVDEFTEFYEEKLDRVADEKAARVAYLKEYKEVSKPLLAQAQELINPKVAHRESELIRKVPELMRVPAYLQVLADARAGRELRERKASGVQMVEVRPAAKPKMGAVAKSASASAPGKSSRLGGEAQGNKGLSEKALADLRAKAEAGDKQAHQAMVAAFMGV
jgi:hypothetical protein